METITHIVKAGIRASHPIDPAELAQPMAGLRKRSPHMPGATLLGAALERGHDREGQEITGGVIEGLRRQGLRLRRAERLRFGDV